ncbi:hypothetical protein [Streptomyces sp. CBMA156]|uniref:hypothetical protein n=1 Tax=Streptomyces sp. CBMA156 TaxID=1930280 RepID=UPI001661C4F3|nr:hypothetical protein [Streptomyces sp. CBMA156]MBD0673476.1 hypothetical protein [Streptomyces sp. CBMA156]
MNQHVILCFFAAATAVPALVLLLWAIRQHRKKPASVEEADATLGRWTAASTDPAAFMAERIRRAAGSDV